MGGAPVLNHIRTILAMLQWVSTVQQTTRCECKKVQTIGHTIVHAMVHKIVQVKLITDVKQPLICQMPQSPWRSITRCTFLRLHLQRTKDYDRNFELLCISEIYHHQELQYLHSNVSQQQILGKGTKGPFPHRRL